MRAGLSTIQQTLTPEAASVLNNSISLAGRRNHGQTTPLHVASTLLAAPTGFLRQACIQSHPNSSHPLQCRALELCYSVALERLPTATSSVVEPPISNALMAALKRAQAHQRRGCPEQQQQPLLAVKVELEQLIISILDDPSVSRVMREASFSSPAVKATIEQSLNNNNVTNVVINNINNNNVSNVIGNNLTPTPLGIGFRSSPVPVSLPVNRNLYLNPRLIQQTNNETASLTPRNLYLNPRLQQPQQGNLNQGSNQLGQHRTDDVKRVIDIMTKPKRRNPILVGEVEPEAIRKEILIRIEKGEFGTGGELNNNVDVISIENEFASVSDKSLIPIKIKELSEVVDKRIGGFNSTKRIIIDLADLKWLVEQPPAAVAASVGRESVAEMTKLVAKFTGKVWLFGTATCETYLRCQVYHPSMETDWDLHAVPITSRSPLPNMFPRTGTNGVLGGSVQSLNTLKPLNSFTTTMNLDLARKAPCCPVCSTSFEQELAKLKESDKQSDSVNNSLPSWLQNAKTNDQSQDKEHVLKQKIQDLQKKWSEECSRIHPNYNHNQSPRLDRVVPMAMPLTGAYKPNMLLRPSQPGQQPRLQPPRTLQEALQPVQQPRLEPPRSPVGTDLVLGSKKPSELTGPKDNEDLTVKDLLGCISSEPIKGKFANQADTDSFKRLLKGLMKKAWWQPDAASTIATTITQCKVESGNRGCVWLLFAGPDRVAKKKMASVLAEHIGGSNPITIALGSRRDCEETDTGFRGKTVLDRIAEAVRQNPFGVIVLSDIDEADMLIRGSIKRAMERSRLTDSHGREISLGNVVFVLTGNWSTASVDEHRADEQRLHSMASSDWQLKLTVSEKRLKRRASWLSGVDKLRRPRKESGSGLDLSLDLNLAIDYDEDRTDGSINSSNLTIDQEDESQQFAVMSMPHELVVHSDGTIVFKPVNFENIRSEIEKTIMNAFSTIVDEKMTIEVNEGAVENILGGLWFGRTSLEEWAEQVLVPSLRQVSARLPGQGEDMMVRLESDRDSVQVGGGGDWLPSKIAVVVDGV
ncbi:protein SUPPRESSOR OF MAX2 1-like isoform X2 [Bidens hawaiensis]|uniref:protein SUPPRESSOR OF MAX2 1-like isoform X2 n=1 Tax=Bidens hawaiensis TaxID=980011 RepID=UPI004049A23A